MAHPTQGAHADRCPLSLVETLEAGPEGQPGTPPLSLDLYTVSEKAPLLWADLRPHLVSSFSVAHWNLHFPCGPAPPSGQSDRNVASAC